LDFEEVNLCQHANIAPNFARKKKTQIVHNRGLGGRAPGSSKGSWDLPFVDRHFSGTACGFVDYIPSHFHHVNYQHHHYHTYTGISQLSSSTLSSSLRHILFFYIRQPTTSPSLRVMEKLATTAKEKTLLHYTAMKARHHSLQPSDPPPTSIAASGAVAPVQHPDEVPTTKTKKQKPMLQQVYISNHV
jgi:hypothetical protein